MRLNRYITEVIRFDIGRAVGLIQKECKQILKYYKSNDPLYRGIGAENSPFITNNVGARLGDRRPKDTPLWAHEYMNKGLIKKFGWPGRDGISVTGKYMQALAYGNTYFFFPTDGFKWVYVKGVRDIFQYIDDAIMVIQLDKSHLSGDAKLEWYEKMEGHDHGNFKMTKKDSPYRDEGLDDVLDKVIDKYTDQPWNRANGEILFNTKKYFMVNTQFAKEIGEELDIWSNLIRTGFFD